MTNRGIQKNGREPRASHPRRGSGGTCKTCTPCRQKKTKCDGARPQCLECSAGGLGCVYPQDARREPRPSRARIQSLEATVTAMLEHMKASGIILPQVQSGHWLPYGNENVDSDTAGAATSGDRHDINQPFQDDSINLLASTAAVASPLPTPSTLVSGASKHGLPPSFLLPTAAPGDASSTKHVQGLPVAHDVEMNYSGPHLQTEEHEPVVLRPNPVSTAADPGPSVVTDQSQAQILAADMDQDDPLPPPALEAGRPCPPAKPASRGHFTSTGVSCQSTVYPVS